MAQVIETGGNCGARVLAQSRGTDEGRDGARKLRCERYGDLLTIGLPTWTWALYVGAAGAAIWGWVVAFA